MNRFIHYIFFGILWLGIGLGGGYAQSLQPQGYFLQDTTKIGQQIQYALTFRYPTELEVIFPDENQAFAPFEYVDRTFIPTRSDSATSLDSVVYTLMTFELDTFQYLALPIYIISTDEEGEADSIQIRAEVDSVYLQQLITQMPDSLDLKANTNYQDVPLQFNYPYFLIGLGILLAIALVVFLVFGEKIRKRWQLRRLQKEYRRFQEQFTRQLQQLDQSPDQEQSEQTLVLWKRYMERLERAPYTKMTTKEIIRRPDKQTLSDDLRAIDRSIYGQHLNGELIGHFEHLKQHTQHRYEQRYRDIQYGSNR
ncbi:MAG: LapA family protein [Bacteroidota bacterium]